MNISQSIDTAWATLVGGSRSAMACLSGRGDMRECQQIWNVLIAAIVVVAVITVLLVSRRIIRDYLGHRAAVKRQRADQLVASEEELTQIKWRGDQPDTDTRTQQELAAEIKRVLQQNKDSGNGA